jgi:hypothetical protein
MQIYAAQYPVAGGAPKRADLLLNGLDPPFLIAK